jgi:DNA invertase Pin-like site-specific DNA recombinase
MRAALYARVSTVDKQDPEMQLAELREYTSRRGWELCGTFVDRTSGSRESRPALDEVVSLCQKRMTSSSCGSSTAWGAASNI